ncbi:CUB domain-containing protein 2-like isoform X2 [Montipora capricornis]|uniref:CUB domain-containing protein 2-like isoform X2 n=1 Tax=Montipora capricornis TaxID=246305 RepID=UPI0035F19555
MFLLLITGLYLIDAVSAASCDKTLSASFGTITSPNYYGSSLYSSNLNCQYDIYVPSGGTNVVKLTWESFDVNGDMPNCYDDNVEIYIGCDRRSIGKYCSKNSYKPFTVYSPDRCLRLVFRTDSSGGGTGFKATYRGISKSTASRDLSESCYGTNTLYNDVGVISSVGWPNSDLNTRDCYWKIWVGSGNGVKIAFMDVNLDDDPGCDRDKIKVKGGYDYQSYDSASTIQYSMCGTKKAFSLTSSKERVWIRFKSNGYFKRRGFVAGYVTYSTSGSRDVSSRGLSSSGVTGIVVALIVVAVFGSCIYYIFVYRRRVLRRQQGAQHQVLSVPPNTTTVQTVTHHAPKPPQPGHEIPGAGYPPPPPSGYAPPPGGYPPPASSAPPPYHQVAGTPYPPMVAGGAPPYPPGQPGEAAAPYPPGQPGTAPPYPPEHPGAGPYPPPPSGGAPYPKQ